MRWATVCMIWSVSCRVEPGTADTCTMMVPWSSSGTRPVFVLFMSSTSPASAAASVPHMSHLCLMKASAPNLYLFRTAVKAVLKTLRKWAAKLSFVSPVSVR